MISGADSPSRETRHATTVAIDGAGVMLTGPSGSGKSGLALVLMAHGADLVADDRTTIELREGWPWALAPERLAGVIEARGVGLICAPFRPAVPLRLVVDMGETNAARLPDPATEIVLGAVITRIRRLDAPHFPGAILALAKGGFWRDG
ncbi:HPr kinase/phosphorylase [Maritimibacter sp. HL-12]|uniref:HPr kinase/phosphorylase n=1 Tax=Maritimibacter sp. HL-12 TaxID=1162418 RepID=UPI000A0F2CB6|nr:HPr kinase/phosphatase C-terminal domain-containing protein [Maritimibacter sp. HL-12]SMH48334.1 Hpr(Ser) kinase/phosphatase [Maritimibacter sp. HL-12]